ncbi:hypothetical protein TUM19329_36940 (plasmid) [Legionella antarctica]|uniref:DUF4440 domain-containing protein n=1 Tax=Legionella antarctica TaxID=2708020 RepID=A0A6F8TAS0_9GAMM|nr:DUF4440 domain-containing protein [Legionella antarctica]BCA97333.1 hypothetical protein TUM19329_36940 [Legionella antarctica]
MEINRVIFCDSIRPQTHRFAEATNPRSLLNKRILKICYYQTNILSPKINMNDSLTKLIIELEEKLLERTDSFHSLVDLIDDEFIEIGSSANEYNKAAVADWLNSNDQSERIGSSFKTLRLSEDLVLLTYISSIKDTPLSEIKKAARSSIWRLRNNKWSMIFHQGTPIK